MSIPGDFFFRQATLDAGRTQCRSFFGVINYGVHLNGFTEKRRPLLHVAGQTIRAKIQVPGAPGSPGGRAVIRQE